MPVAESRYACKTNVAAVPDAGNSYGTIDENCCDVDTDANGISPHATGPPPPIPAAIVTDPDTAGHKRTAFAFADIHAPHVTHTSSAAEG